MIRWRKFKADILIIAGDTANSPERTIRLMKEVSQYFHHVFFVDGNHEHYSNVLNNRTPEECLALLRKLLDESDLENVDFLPKSGHRLLGEYDIIGVNGWYSMDLAGDPQENTPIWQDFMNDDRNGGIVASGTNPRLMAARDAAKLSGQLESIKAGGGKAIVVTHTAPLRESLVWRASPQWNYSNNFYMSSFLGEVLEEYTDIVPYWIHGHTHFRKMYKHMNTEVVINPRGYPGENPNWSPVVLHV